MILVDFGYHVYAISLPYSQNLLSYLLSLHDEGYSRNVSGEGYSRNVSGEGYSRNVSGEGYSRNVSGALDLISTFLSFMFMLFILSIMYFINDLFYQ